MKYVVVLGDGMADYKIEKINGTPLDVSKKPFVDGLVKRSKLGLVKTVPDGMKPGSDVANLSVLGYNPQESYTGRSPLEAVSIGIDLKDTDITARVNLVTLSDEEKYEDKKMIDYSSGEITTGEAKELIKTLSEKLKMENCRLVAGISYRHCLVVDNGTLANDMTPPHDITDKCVKDYLPTSKTGQFYLDLMKQSVEILKGHPVNEKRIKEGKRPATSIWVWGEGSKPNLKSFEEKYGVKGAMISAVDLLKGMAKLAKMQVYEVEGATGNYDTNFIGKAQTALKALETNDFVYIHVEGPDECGHHADLENKIYSIEQISEVVAKTIAEGLNAKGEQFRMLICPDHPTPISIKTHTAEPVPFMIYDSTGKYSSQFNKYCEDTAKSSGIEIDSGEKLMQEFLAK